MQKSPSTCKASSQPVVYPSLHCALCHLRACNLESAKNRIRQAEDKRRDHCLRMTLYNSDRPFACVQHACPTPDASALRPCGAPRQNAFSQLQPATSSTQSILCM